MDSRIGIIINEKKILSMAEMVLADRHFSSGGKSINYYTSISDWVGLALVVEG
jgi:hypothetical protein